MILCYLTSICVLVYVGVFVAVQQPQLIDREQLGSVRDRLCVCVRVSECICVSESAYVLHGFMVCMCVTERGSAGLSCSGAGGVSWGLFAVG